MSETGSSTDHLQDGPTASRPTYLLIQVLRAVAALMVVVHHGTIMLHDRNGLPIGNWVNGGAGVDLFFVISGFVMTLSSAPLRNSAHAARTFLARRLERIVPLYWLATTVKLLILVIAPAIALNALGSAGYIVASYLFLPWSTRHGDVEPLLVVGWTLNFEMMFYALFAVALALRASLLRTIAPVLLLLSAVAFLPAVASLPVLHFYGHTIVIDFLFGLILAREVHRLRRMPAWLAWMLGVIGLAILMTWSWGNFSAFRGVQWGLPAMAVVAAAIRLEAEWGRRTPRWMLELGDASYSIYLTHGFILPACGLLLARVGTGWPGVIPVSLVCMTAIATLASEAVYRLVELPIMRFFKGRRHTAIPANAESSAA